MWVWVWVCVWFADITYTVTETQATLVQVAQGLLDFACLDLPLPDPESIFLFVPIAGAAVVPAYHLSSLSTTSNETTLVLDGQTLALIFMGNISTWDHPAIQLLNPGLALPHANITIALTSGQALGETDVFKKALSLFSDDFARELSNAGNDFANMRPAMEGRAFIALDESERLRFVQVRSHWPATHHHCIILLI